MTIDEFVAAFAAGPGRKPGWHLSHVNGMLRRRRDNIGNACPMDDLECPISSMQNETATRYWHVAIDLGLSRADAYQITSAADNTSSTRQLRRRLLKATGRR